MIIFLIQLLLVFIMLIIINHYLYFLIFYIQLLQRQYQVQLKLIPFNP